MEAEAESAPEGPLQQLKTPSLRIPDPQNGLTRRRAWSVGVWGRRVQEWSRQVPVQRQQWRPECPSLQFRLAGGDAEAGKVSTAPSPACTAESHQESGATRAPPRTADDGSWTSPLRRQLALGPLSSKAARSGALLAEEPLRGGQRSGPSPESPSGKDRQHLLPLVNRSL